MPPSFSSKHRCTEQDITDRRGGPALAISPTKQVEASVRWCSQHDPAQENCSQCKLQDADIEALILVGSTVPPHPQVEDSPAKRRSTIRRLRRLRQFPVPAGTTLEQEKGVDFNCLAPTEQSDETRELMVQLEGDRASQLAAAYALHDSVWRLSRDKFGCRVVQLAFEVAPRALQDQLVLELHGHVRDAVFNVIDSPHANFVIQQVIRVMPARRSMFVAEELLGMAKEVAKHRFGCRIISRLLEHSETEASTTSLLVDEFLPETRDLLQEEFGRYALQAVLEHGLPRQRSRIAVALLGKPADGESMLSNAMTRFGSSVFETAMLYCALDDKQSICRALLREPNSVLQLAKSQFGCFVLKTLLACPGEEARAAMKIIVEASAELQGNKPGKEILELQRISNHAQRVPQCDRVGGLTHDSSACMDRDILNIGQVAQLPLKPLLLLNIAVLP